jgi:hypothetical protein
MDDSPACGRVDIFAHAEYSVSNEEASGDNPKHSLRTPASTFRCVSDFTGQLGVKVNDLCPRLTIR